MWLPVLVRLWAAQQHGSGLCHPLVKGMLVRARAGRASMVWTRAKTQTAPSCSAPLHHTRQPSGAMENLNPPAHLVVSAPHTARVLCIGGRSHAWKRAMVLAGRRIRDEVPRSRAVIGRLRGLSGHGESRPALDALCKLAVPGAGPYEVTYAVQTGLKHLALAHVQKKKKIYHERRKEKEMGRRRGGNAR